MQVITTVGDFIKSCKAELSVIEHSLNTKNKLDDREVARLLELSDDIKILNRAMIYRDHLNGTSNKEIAKRYGFTPSRITQIVKEIKELMED
ncbi:TPA: hypothetical protein NU514_000132 [Escherichia coli]|nr:hypothetical protein [Escherichia coli]